MLRSFRSSDRKGTEGIEFGAEWYKAIMEKLGGATDVVALLTPYSLDRPWILYEAGVAKGKLDTIVFGIAIGIPLEKASSGPFAQFQNSSDDEDSITKLMLQLIRRNPDAEPREEAVRRQVQAFRARMTELMKGRAKTPSQPAAHMDETGMAKLFEEVKIILLDLPARLEDKLGRGEPLRRRKYSQYTPAALMDLATTVSEDSDDPMGILLLASITRDDFPWIYESASHLYSIIKNGSQQEIARAFESFERLCDMTFHGQIGHEMSRYSEDTYRLIREIPDMFRYLLQRQLHAKRKPTRKNIKPAA
jgi:hypothetical protein